MADTDDFGPTSHSFVSQRLRLHYVDWGNTSAPPLLLQHGGRDHSRSWDWVARELRRDWHVIAPDLRGHGDSALSPDGAYSMAAYVYDMAQLIHQQGLAPVTLVAHSLGAMISLRYTGIYPETVRKLAVIEGTGVVTPAQREAMRQPTAARWRRFVTERRELSGRLPRRYASIDEALARMQEENRYLSTEQARHLTIHGASQNEDGTWSWKFDNYTRSAPPLDLTDAQLHELWESITCPVLLCHGQGSWATSPAEDGVAQHFRDARVVEFDHAGHWLHHDRTKLFLKTLKDFL